MNPTGNITFFDGDSAIRGCASIPLGTGGTPADAAQCSTGTLLPATHSITAAYTGDVANAPSLSAVLSQVSMGLLGPERLGRIELVVVRRRRAAACRPRLALDAFSFARVRVSARVLRLRSTTPAAGR